METLEAEEFTTTKEVQSAKVGVEIIGHQFLGFEWHSSSRNGGLVWDDVFCFYTTMHQSLSLIS